MENILCRTAELKREIQNSILYNNYINAREKVRRNKELEQRIQSFSRQKLEYGLKTTRNIALTLDEEKHISKMYFDLCLNDDARTFFESEKVLLELIKQVYDILSFDLDLPIEQLIHQA